jgi:hypothetical protein
MFTYCMYLCLLLYPFKGTESQYSFLRRLPRCHKVVSMTPRKPNFFRRSVVQKTTFLCINNVVEICLRIPRSLWDCRSHFRGPYETAEAALAGYMRQRKQLPWSLLDSGSHTFPTIISIFSANSKPIRNGFSPWSRALGGIVWWKNPRVENLVTLSLLIRTKAYLLAVVSPSILPSHAVKHVHMWSVYIRKP